MDRLDASAGRPFYIEPNAIANVDCLGRLCPNGLQRQLEDTGIWLLEADNGGHNDRINVDSRPRPGLTDAVFAKHCLQCVL